MPEGIELQNVKKFMAKGNLHCEYEILEYGSISCKVKLLKAGDGPVTSGTFRIKTGNLLCAIDKILE